MAIRVNYEPSAEAVGLSAYTAGRGQRAERDKIHADEMSLRSQQLENQRFEAAMGAYLRNKAINEGSEADRREFEFRQRAYEEGPARQLAAAMQQQELLKDRFKWEYSEQQQREMQEVQQGISWVRQQLSEGKWTPEQAEKAEQQLWKRFHGIMPQMIFDDSLSPQENFERGRIDLGGGNYMMMDKNGKFYDPQEGTKIAKAKMVADLMKQTDANNEPVYSAEEAKQIVAAAFGDAEMPQAKQSAQSVAGSLKSKDLEDMFKAAIKGKPQQSKKGGKTGFFSNDVYGDIAYGQARHDFVIEAANKGIPPEEAQQLFDSLWTQQARLEPNKFAPLATQTAQTEQQDPLGIR